MVSISADPGNLPALVEALTAVGPRVEQQTRAAVAKVTHDGEATARMTAPYRTGFLRGSIHGQTEGDTGTITVGAFYAPYLEYGTSRMRPRPFMAPTHARIEPTLVRAVEQIAKGALP